jgi:hypothetical protein
MSVFCSVTARTPKPTSAEEFKRLKRRDREVLRSEDLTEADLEAIRKAEPPAEAAAFDHEVSERTTPRGG